MTGAMVSTPTAGRTGKRTRTKGIISLAVDEILAALD
jgi:hypothetical protein